jgi:hypothetical protein
MLPNTQNMKTPLMATPKDQRDATRMVMRASGMNRSALDAIEAADHIIDAAAGRKQPAVTPLRPNV